jgi:D-serine deaminase-like pyridoxal phosphate-dependent protein
MKTFLCRLARVAGGALSLALASGFIAAAAQTPTAAIVDAGDKFLATLSPEQRQKVVYAFDDATQRARWSNLPTGFVPLGLELSSATATREDFW